MLQNRSLLQGWKMRLLRQVPNGCPMLLCRERVLPERNLLQGRKVRAKGLPNDGHEGLPDDGHDEGLPNDGHDEGLPNDDENDANDDDDGPKENDEMHGDDDDDEIHEMHGKKGQG
jgi:hypothetical protein